MLARFTRAALLETLYQDYVRTARAKGLGERPVVGGHALRNALIPVVTVVGLQFGAFMGGAVITEAIFDYPGLGRMLLHAILTRDYTVVQGTILFVVVAFVADQPPHRPRVRAAGSPDPVLLRPRPASDKKETP